VARTFDDRRGQSDAKTSRTGDQMILNIDVKPACPVGVAARPTPKPT
jgi:hypothetical protein